MATRPTLEKSTLTQPPLNTSFMGVVVGAAKHFGSKLSTMEFFVESGFAFALNIHPGICPSGPYYWNHESVFDSLQQLGLTITRITPPEIPRTRESRLAIESQVRSGFEDAVVSMEGLDHQLVVNCDEDGFEFAMPWGPDAEACLPKISYADWRELESPPIFGFYRIEPCETSIEENRVRNALKNAIDMYENNATLAFDGYEFGLSAYNKWISTLKSGDFDQQGQWWNCMVWGECRFFAMEYFRNWPLPHTSETAELASHFGRISQSISDASKHDLDTQEKLNLLQDAFDVESRVPELLHKIASNLD